MNEVLPADGPGSAADKPDRAPGGWERRHVADTTSTNADLLADTSAGDRTVLRADHQTAGRGRIDRRWESPPGANLLVSLKFLPADLTAAAELPRRVALAAALAAGELGGVDVALKWPNDLVTSDGKLAGVLAQLGTGGELVVGIGVNVGWAPPGAASLGDAVTPERLLDAVLEHFDALPVDTEEFAAAYRQRLATLGQRVRVELPVGELVGTAVDVDTSGRLLVRSDDGSTRGVDVGDIVHLRPAD